MAFNGKVESDFLKLSTNVETKQELLNFTANDYATLREALINYIKTAYPLDYENFVESDLGVMLIELVAYMGGVLSLKADMLANENYLSTAKNRNNVAKLLNLIGIKMKGPISAVADARISLNSASLYPTITIPENQRVITLSSPEDGQDVSYTLYKVDGTGSIEDFNGSSTLFLETTESDSQASTVWSNLVLVEGSLAVEEGVFEATDANKTIVLGAGPVVEKSIQLFITNAGSDSSGAWTQIDNLYFASGPSHKVFEVSYDDNFAATLFFGNDILGKSPTTNSEYLILYRVGGGSRGNIKNNVVQAAISTGNTANTNTREAVLTNTSVGSGGQNAETVDQAKKYAGLSFKSQNRLVTIDDFSTFANTFFSQYGAVGKAKAAVRDAYSSANIIDLYILQVASDSQLQRASVQLKKDLLDAMQPVKMLTDEIVVVDGLIRSLDLSITVKYDKFRKNYEEEIKLKVKNKVLEYFSPRNCDFGKNFVFSDLNRFVFTLPEVVYCMPDNTPEIIPAEFNEIIQLNNLIINMEAI
jgi:hypothetical protein